RLLNGEINYELMVFDYIENIPKWGSYKRILDNYDNIILFTVSSKIPEIIEPQLARDNVYCVPLGSKNTRHLNCSLRIIRNHILRNRRYLRNLFDKLFDEFIIGLTINNSVYRLEEGMSRLLSGLSNLFDFKVVCALMKEGKNHIQVFKNDKEVDFCSLLCSDKNITRVCEDFLEGRAIYIPSELRYKDFLRFNATPEKARILVHCFKDTEYCGLCHLLGYRSLIFLPLNTAGQRKWLFLFADRNDNKDTEEICRYLEEKIPFLTGTISYLEQYWQEKALLNLHQISLKTGHIGVWEYEVDTRKIISSGLQTLFPYLRVPDELTEWWKYIHPLDRVNFWHAVKPCIHGATNSFAVDHRLLLPGDRLVWVRTIGECISRQGKYAQKLVGIGMDITAFMESEEKLKNVKENLRVASELGSIGLWSWDILKNEYTMNQSALDMFRISPKKFYTLEDWFNCIVPVHRELIRKELGEALAKEDGVFNVQYQIYYRGMYKQWIHTYGRVSARDSKGNPIRFSGTHIDITDKKRLEKQLANEVVISSLYAGFARSLLNLRDEGELTQMVCQTGVDILNSAFCFTGYFDSDRAMYFFYGIDKKKINKFEISFNMKELVKKEKILRRFIEAGIPLLINDVQDKEHLLFGKVPVNRLLCYPSYTPSHELVFVIAVNSEDNYTPSHWESIEWITSVYAQALERIRLEKKNLQKTKELEETVEKLQEALNTVKKLHGLLPICARCKRIRDDTGYWHEVEVYIRQHTEAEFSHGICPQCAKELYGDFL
ncbi:MAG: PAS domain-containing protein, partial [Candidatus Hydrogenedens sp.]